MVKHCVPCEDKTGALDSTAIQASLSNLDGWSLESGDVSKITKTYSCKSFVSAVDFVRTVADIAEEENHHPDMEIHYNSLKFLLYTHSVKGVTENDFIIAERIEQVAHLFV